MSVPYAEAGGQAVSVSDSGVSVSDAAWQTDLLVNGEPFAGAYSNDGSGHEFVAYGKPEEGRFKGVRFFRNGKAELVRVGKDFLAKLEAFRIADKAKISSLVKAADSAVRSFAAKGISAVRTLDEMDKAFTKAAVDRITAPGRAVINRVQARAYAGRRDPVKEFMKMEKSRAFSDDALVAQMKSLRDAVVHAKTDRTGSVLPMFVTRETVPVHSDESYFEHPSVCLNMKGKALQGMNQLSAMVACSQVYSSDNFYVIAGGRDSSSLATNFSLAKISSVDSDGYPVRGAGIEKGTFHLHDGKYPEKVSSVVNFRKSQLNAPNPNALFIDLTGSNLSCKEYMAGCMAAAELGIAVKTTDAQKIRCREEFLKLAESLDKRQYGNFWKDFDSDLRYGCRAQARNFLDRRRIELANAKSMRNMPSVGQAFRKERDAVAMEM